MAQEDSNGNDQKTPGTALLAGFAGAATVTAINEVARRLIPAAPRLDVLGMRGLARTLGWLDKDVPPEGTLFWASMAGDLVSNTLYYSLAGTGAAARTRGALLGLAAGLGAAFLPEPLGLGRGPTERSPATQAMAVAWYLAGGVAAGMVAAALSSDEAEG